MWLFDKVGEQDGEPFERGLTQLDGRVRCLRRMKDFEAGGCGARATSVGTFSCLTSGAGVVARVGKGDRRSVMDMSSERGGGMVAAESDTKLSGLLKFVGEVERDFGPRGIFGMWSCGVVEQVF